MLREGKYLGGTDNYRLLACCSCGATWQESKLGRYCPKCKTESEAKQMEAEQTMPKYGLTVIDEGCFIKALGRTNNEIAWREKIKEYKQRYPKAECSLGSMPGSEEKTEVIITRQYEPKEVNNNGKNNAIR